MRGVCEGCGGGTKEVIYTVPQTAVPLCIVMFLCNTFLYVLCTTRSKTEPWEPGYPSNDP